MAEEERALLQLQLKSPGKSLRSSPSAPCSYHAFLRSFWLIQEFTEAYMGQDWSRCLECWSKQNSPFHEAHISVGRGREYMCQIELRWEQWHRVTGQVTRWVSSWSWTALAERISPRVSLRSEQIKIMHHLEQSMPGRGDKCENWARLWRLREEKPVWLELMTLGKSRRYWDSKQKVSNHTRACLPRWEVCT